LSYLGRHRDNICPTYAEGQI